jgi:hypothetical protein
MKYLKSREHFVFIKKQLSPKFSNREEASEYRKNDKEKRKWKEKKKERRGEERERERERRGGLSIK